MVDTTATKTRVKSSTESPEETLGLQTFKNPIVKNTSKAIMWVDEESFILPSEVAIRGRGGSVKQQQGQLTKEQWERRSPEQWGVLIANELADIRTFPNSSDEERCLKAKEEEEKRIENKELTARRQREAQEAQEKMVFSR